MKEFEMEVTYKFSGGGESYDMFRVMADNKKEAMQQIERLAKANAHELSESNWEDVEIEYGYLITWRRQYK